MHLLLYIVGYIRTIELRFYGDDIFGLNFFRMLLENQSCFYQWTFRHASLQITSIHLRLL